MQSDRELNIVWSLLIVLVVIALARRRRWKPTGTAYGLAKWASDQVLQAAGMLAGRGLILGRTLTGKLITLPRYTHISVYAPTGAGKGVSYVLTTLLSYTRGAVFVWDPKAENFRKSAHVRAAMGQRIIRIDPFQLCGPGDRFNVLEFLKPGPALVDEARTLAEAMVVRPTGGERDPFWNNASVVVLTAMIVLTVLQMKKEERNLTGDLRSRRSIGRVAALQT